MNFIRHWWARRTLRSLNYCDVHFLPRTPRMRICSACYGEETRKNIAAREKVCNERKARARSAILLLKGSN